MKFTVSAQSFLKVVGIILGLFSALCCLLILFIGIPPVPPSKEEAWPTWAPDSQQLAYECYLDGPINEGSRSIYDLTEANGVWQSFYSQEAADICISNIDGSNQVRVTTDSGGDLYPVWSPDGSQILYLRHRDGFYLITPDGHNKRRLIPLRGGDYGSPGEPDGTTPVWSPDGQYLLFSACLDNPDRDIYVADVNTGTITNLTLDSRTQDIEPLWTLNGQKIVFLSTASSSWFDTPCSDLKGDAPHQLEVINADGSGESIIYGKKFYYAFIAVSNDGQIIFVADLVSLTNDDFYAHNSPDKRRMYRINLEESEPIEISVGDPFGTPSWSPDGKYVAYNSYSSLEILDIETQEVLRFPYIEPYIRNFVWSPNSQYIAANIADQEDGASDEEDHIYIFDLQHATFHPLLQE